MAFPGFFGPPNIPKMKSCRDVDGLIRALEYRKDPAIRSGAAVALGETGDARAVSPLILCLSDDYEQVCIAAFKALWEIGPPAVAPLMAGLRDDDCTIHDTIAKELQMIGGNGAVEPLVTALADRNERVRQTAAAVLVDIGTPAVQPLIGEFLDEHSRIQGSAGVVLQHIGRPAIRPLTIALMPNDPAVREKISGLLKQIGPPAVEQLCFVLISGELQQRHGAAEALGKIGDPKAAVPLIIALDDMHPDVRRKAAEALLTIGGPAVPALIAALKEGTAGVRDSAATVLEQIGLPAVAPLMAVLEDTDSGIRDRAAEVLGTIGLPVAVPPLIGVLHEPDGDMRAQAAEALGKIGDARAVEPLLGALKDADETVRMKVIEALIRIGDPRSADEVLQALKEENPGVRSNTKYVLETISSDPSDEPLIRALLDELEDDEATSADDNHFGPFSGPSPKFQRRYVDARGHDHELFRASSPEEARAFLKTRTVDIPDYSVIVETPDGTWGRDRNGLFLDHLEPWQASFADTADCDGTIISWSSYGLEMAARREHDNFVCDVRCGRCSRIWTDGIRYRNLTAVRCPGCNAVNRIDSAPVICYFI
jgi:HEAT repeat protein